MTETELLRNKRIWKAYDRYSHAQCAVVGARTDDEARKAREELHAAEAEFNRLFDESLGVL